MAPARAWNCILIAALALTAYAGMSAATTDGAYQLTHDEGMPLIN